MPLLLRPKGTFLLAAALAIVLSHVQGRALTSSLLWLSGKQGLPIYHLTATLVKQQAAFAAAQNATAQGADHLKLPVGALFWREPLEVVDLYVSWGRLCREVGN